MRQLSESFNQEEPPERVGLTVEMYQQKVKGRGVKPDFRVTGRNLSFRLPQSSIGMGVLHRDIGHTDGADKAKNIYALSLSFERTMKILASELEVQLQGYFAHTTQLEDAIPVGNNTSIGAFGQLALRPAWLGKEKHFAEVGAHFGNPEPLLFNAHVFLVWESNWPSQFSSDLDWTAHLTTQFGASTDHRGHDTGHWSLTKRSNVVGQIGVGLTGTDNFGQPLELLVSAQAADGLLSSHSFRVTAQISPHAVGQGVKELVKKIGLMFQ